jgi:hypothetical protein
MALAGKNTMLQTPTLNNADQKHDHRNNQQNMD